MQCDPNPDTLSAAVIPVDLYSRYICTCREAGNKTLQSDCDGQLWGGLYARDGPKFGMKATLTIISTEPKHTFCSRHARPKADLPLSTPRILVPTYILYSTRSTQRRDERMSSSLGLLGSALVVPTRYASVALELDDLQCQFALHGRESSHPHPPPPLTQVPTCTYALTVHDGKSLSGRTHTWVSPSGWTVELI